MAADETDVNPGSDRRRTVPLPPGWRLCLLLVAGVVPWIVVLGGGGVSFVHAFGILTLDPTTLTNLYEYLFVLTDGLPRRLQVWPASVLLYSAAVASAFGGILGREDPRLTAGLLVFAGIAQVHLAYGLVRVGVTVVPVAPIVLWGIVWWAYWPMVRNRGLLGPGV
ncbi:MAG: TIGR04206 family protein [Natronomonas sp.]